MKMEENVRRLEGQLKDTFKGQLDSFAVVKDNMEMTDKLREVEKKSALYQDRLKEYEEILKRQSEEGDTNDTAIKTLKHENDCLRSNLSAMEE